MQLAPKHQCWCIRFQEKLQYWCSKQFSWWQYVSSMSAVAAWQLRESRLCDSDSCRPSLMPCEQLPKTKAQAHLGTRFDAEDDWLMTSIRSSRGGWNGDGEDGRSRISSRAAKGSPENSTILLAGTERLQSLYFLGKRGSRAWHQGHCLT